MKQVLSKPLACLLPVLVGVLVYIGYALFPLSELTPELAEEVAAAVGIRPAPEALYGFWRLVVSCLPPDVTGLGVAGRVAAALFALLMSVSLYRGLSLLFTMSSPRARFVRRLVPLISLVTAVMAAFADPVWRAFALFSPAALSLLLGMLAVTLFVSRMSGGHSWRFSLTGLLVGILASETPLALLMGILLAVAYFRLMRKLAISAALPEQVFIRLGEFPLWRVALLFLVGLLLGVAVNVCGRGLCGDVGVLDGSLPTVAMQYADAYVNRIGSAASGLGYMLGFALTVLPLMAALGHFARLTDDDYRFPFGVGIVLLVMGVFAYFSQGSVRGLWFWTWGDDAGMVDSPLLLAAFSSCASAAVALIGGIFAFDAFDRKRRRERGPAVNRCYAGAVVLLLLCVTVLILPQLPHAHMRAIMDFNGRAVRETVRELNGARWVFTDGTADAALELEAWKAGTPTFAVNLMGGSEGRDGRLILRGLRDGGDFEPARLGAPALLRVWACEKEGGLTNVALQLGFALWKREPQLKPPAASAFVARVSGLRETDVTGASEITARFADEAVRLTDIVRAPDVPPALRREFFRHVWRLSRLARYRRDDPVADRLDLCNSVLRRTMQDIENERIRVFMLMTPTEALDLALRRTDFSEATRYAAPVLKTDDKNPRANFAMGMYFLLENRCVEAEPYFKKILETNPNEAVVLNNMSILCRKLRRYDEARKYADRALKILPDNEEVQKTHKAAYQVK